MIGLKFRQRDILPVLLMLMAESSVMVGYGAGREIVNWLIEQAKKKGITKIYLETPECGCSLYQEMGFTDVYGYMQIKDKSVF